MIDVQEKKEKIISFLKESGPSLPVRIAKSIDMSPVFASAILSELLGEKRIKMSNLKVGSSPLYLIPGEEERLEEHSDNLNPAEKEAYLKLKREKILSDEEESPMIRVALRNIRDFAIPYKEGEKIMWKYAFKKEEKTEPNNNPKAIEKEERIGEKKEPETQKIEEEPKKTNEKKVEPIFENSEETPEFLSEIKSFLQGEEIEMIKEIEIGKKEIVATIKVPSNLGNLTFLLVAKNKKATTEEEINQSLQRAIHEQMPCLYILRKEPSKKIQNLIETNNLIRLRVMN